MRIYISSYLFLFALLNTVSAQGLQYEVSSWYWKQRFEIADQNHNQQLDKSELALFPREFTYFLTANYFELADENKDAQLSLTEISTRKKTEFAFRTTQEKRQIRALTQSEAVLQTPTATGLKANPVLVAKLFANYTWLTENTKLAKEIYSDKEWMTANPIVNTSFEQNLLWLASTPQEAKLLYDQQKNGSPMMSAWRASHLKFIRQNPALDKFYQLNETGDTILIGE